MKAGREAPWIRVLKPREDARLRLICLAHAGGGAGEFSAWPGALPPRIEVLGVELPGRGSRRAEPLVTDLERLIEGLAPALETRLEPRWAIFGHSMGGLLAFELVRALRGLGVAEPAFMWVAACRAPDQLGTGGSDHALPADQLVERLRPLGGIPEEIAAHPAALRAFLPTLRADLQAVEGYRYRPEQPLHCPIVALGGESDPAVTPGDLDGWAVHTTGAFRALTLPGAHFVTRSSRAELLGLIGAEARAWI